MKTALKSEPWQAVRTLLFLITCHLSLVTALQSQTLVNVNDTLYNADGTKASGRIVVSWDPFTAASGQTMDGGTLVYTIPATGASAGVVNFSLAPNIGALPAGTSYRAQYFLANGASYYETWVVPSSGPVTIANVRVSTPPTPITTINPSQVVGGTANRCARFDASGVLSAYTADCSAGGGGSITTREVDGAPSISGTTIIEFDQADGLVLTNPSGTTARLDLTNAPDSAVSDAITLTNLTQITNRAISDTTGDLAASRVDDGGAAATQALFSGAGAAAGFRAIADGDIPAALTRDSEVNIQGTANQIVSSGSGPAPTLSIANPFTFPGKATLAASVAGAASGNVPSGTAPSTPTAGDIWNESGLLKFRDASTTQTLLFQSRQILTSGAALSGGGDLSANRTITLSASPDSASVVGTGRTLTGGAGIGALGDLSADRTIATASGETDFLASGALTCGVSTRGRAQVHTTPLQYCDNAGTPALQYAAYATSGGASLTGDTIVSFFPTFTTAQLATELSDEDYEPGDEVSTEGVLDLPDLQGILDVPSGGTGAAPGADDQALISDSTSAATWRGIPNCVTNNMLTYTAATNTFGCDADDGAGGGAPVGVQYVVGATDPTLTAEKVLTDGSGIDTVLAGGDDGTATIHWTGPLTQAVSLTSDATGETIIFSFEAAYTTGQYLLIRQQTGNTTGGTLLDVRAADAQTTVFRAGDGTNGITVSQAGALTAEGTGAIVATDTVCTGCLSATELGTDSVSADELNATGVEAELEAVLDLADLQNRACADLSDESALCASSDIDSVTGQANWGTAATKETADLTISGVEVDFEGGAAEGYPRLAQSATPPAGDCDAAAEEGRLYWDTDSTSGQRLFGCEGVTGWVKQGDGGGGGGNSFTTIGTATADTTTDTLTITDSLSIDLATTNDPEDLSAALRYDQTLAGDPALAVSTLVPSDDCPGGGFLSEGSTANTNEQLHCFKSNDEADTTREITENDATQTLTNKTLAAADNVIEADTGDSATAFFSAGQIEAARGGTGIDSSGSTGVARVSAGTWSANADISHLAASTSANLRGVLSDEDGTGAAIFNTPTAFTLDAESGTNAITKRSFVLLDMAICDGGSAFRGGNDAAVGETAPAASCNDTGSIQRPSLDFSGSAVNAREWKIVLPVGWTGNVDLDLWHVAVAASPTGNVEWDISTICRAAGETWDAAFNAIQTITDAVAAQNTMNLATQTSVTMTTCAAEGILTVKVSRDGTNDTNNDLAKLIEGRITLRWTD